MRSARSRAGIPRKDPGPQFKAPRHHGTRTARRAPKLGDVLAELDVVLGPRLSWETWALVGHVAGRLGIDREVLAAISGHGAIVDPDTFREGAAAGRAGAPPHPGVLAAFGWLDRRYITWSLVRVGLALGALDDRGALLALLELEDDAHASWLWRARRGR